MMHARTQLTMLFHKAELTRVLAFVIAVALLIVSARIQIPFWPVPLTMQSAVVLMLPCVLGVRMGMVSILAYLGLGMAGYPVFAHTANAGMGIAYLAGPTGGYLLGFAVAALATGSVYEKYSHKMTVGATAALMLGGHAIIFAFGVLWLAFGAPRLGLDQAVALGLVPFLAGSLAKSVFAAMCVRRLRKAV